MVLVLVVLPPLAGLLGGRVPEGSDGALGWTLARTLAEVAAFVALMLLVGRRAFPWVLWQVTKTGSRELFTLAVIVAAVTIHSLIVAGALVTIAANPLAFRAADALQRWLGDHPRLAGRLQRAVDPLAELPASTDERFLSKQVVLVGYGRVGQHIAAALGAVGLPFVVVEENRAAVEALRAAGIAAVFGNASQPLVLVQAHIARARMLVVATPETIEVRQMVQTARALNPAIEIAVRSHNAHEAGLLESEGVGRVFVGESELAAAMARHVEQVVSGPGRRP